MEPGRKMRWEGLIEPELREYLAIAIHLARRLRPGDYRLPLVPGTLPAWGRTGMGFRRALSRGLHH